MIKVTTNKQGEISIKASGELRTVVHELRAVLRYAIKNLTDETQSENAALKLENARLKNIVETADKQLKQRLKGAS